MIVRNLSQIEWVGQPPFQVAPLFGEEDLNSKGSKLQVIKVAPGGTVARHFHKVRTEAFYVLHGQGTIYFGDESADCAQNDFLLCPTGTVHSAVNNGSDDFIVAIFAVNDPGQTDMLWVDDSNEPE